MNATAPIPALETVWRGYRFRSRCEARWAVFFDALGIPFEYEKEGFDLPSGRYLPDFWLPREEVWAEVKGCEFTERETNLCEQLCVATQSAVLALVGQPDFKAYRGCLLFEGSYYLPNPPIQEAGEPCYWDDLLIGRYKNPPSYSGFFFSVSDFDGGFGPMEEWGCLMRPGYAEAVYASRAERFGT